jgi:hypothetical protein
MNATQLASRCRWLAKQLAEEAQLWHGGRRRDLLHAALQLAYQARVRQPDLAVAQAVLDASESVLVLAMTIRAEAQLNHPTRGIGGQRG